MWKAAYESLWVRLYGSENLPKTDHWDTLDFMHEMENMVSYEIKELYYSAHQDEAVI
jgi:hypothetical protein